MNRPPLLYLLATLLTVSALGLNAAHAETYYRLPPEMVSAAGGAITVTHGDFEDSYVFGLGWLSGADLPAPRLDGDAVLVPSAFLDRLGPLGPVPVTPGVTAAGAPAGPARVTGVRFGGSGQVRVVLDLDLPSAEGLRRLERRGRLERGEPLRIDLPELQLPPPVQPYRGIEVTLLPRAGGTALELRGPALAYHVFALESPTRLVIDVVPLQDEVIATGGRELRPGVTLRQFGAPTPVGQSRVHLLEIAPGAGEFRVVGRSETPMTLSQLASGSFAAINAGYFDTRTFEAIGLLRVDHWLQSLPSRNRASIAFSDDGPVIGRVRATLAVRASGRVRIQDELRAGRLELHTADGQRAGGPGLGVITVQGGRVTANRVGPLTVPAGGFALVYSPELRELALIDPGEPLSYDLQFLPHAFNEARYAVEAGPLLVDRGLPAFEPDLEAFQRGQRILDQYTQQSAIGVRADGTVLLLVADNMRAEDLVPLFVSLGAEQAMRLDSGGSAALYADGRVVNRSIERRIVSAIVFLPGEARGSLP